jgi:hypothetical protein
MTNLRDQILSSSLLLWAVALLVFAGMVIFFWPGVGTYEVLQFAHQRKLPVMNDWKSPFVAGIYWLSDDFFRSTGPVLLAQQALFWSGLALLAKSAFRRVLQQIFFFLTVSILPPIWITEIMLWKEAWTLSFLSLSIGATFAFLRRNSIFLGIIALLSAILLTATRHNTPLLAFPAFYIIARTIADKMSPTIKNRRRLILCTVFAALLCVSLSFNWALNQKGKQRCHIWHHGLLWDLAAVSLAEKEMLIPEAFRKTGQDGSLENVQAFFTYYNSDPLFYNKNSPLKLYGTAWTACAEQIPLGVLIEKWRYALITHPGSYLYHRLIYLIHLLGIPDKSADWGERYYYRIDSEFTAAANRSDLFERMRGSKIYQTAVDGIPLRGWFYMIIFWLSALGLSSKKSRTNAYLWSLWIAGCAYFVSFAVFGSAAVMRFMVVYVILGPAIFAGRWMDRTT